MMMICSLLFLFFSLMIFGCTPPPDKDKDQKSAAVDKKTVAKTKKEASDKKDSKDDAKKLKDDGKEFEKLAKEKSKKDDDKYLIDKKIVKTDIIALNPVSNVKVREFKVRISQIDNTKFPEVTLLVSVTDKDGNPLVVRPDFFQIEEHGVVVKKENILSIVQKKEEDSKVAQIPLQVLLAIDKSGSMRGAAKEEDKQPMAYAKNAAIEFIKQAHTNDLIKVIAFDGDMHPLGANENAIGRIKELKPKGTTALYGALLTGVKELEIGSGIKAMILLSDGKNDTRGTINKYMKEVTLDQGIYAAAQLAVPVFTIGFGSDFDDFTLSKIAQDTHALFFKTADKEEIAKLYSLIRQIISSQYVIRYRSESLSPVTTATVRLGTEIDQRTFSTPDWVINRIKKSRKEIAIVEQEKERLAQFEGELNQRLANLTKKESELQEKYVSMREKENELNQVKKDLDKKEGELSNFETLVKNLEAELKAEKERLKKEQENIEGLRATLTEKEKKLNDRNNAQSQREQSLDQRDTALNKKNQDLNQKENALSDRNESIQKEEAKLTQYRAGLEAKDEDLKRKIKENDELLSRLETERKLVGEEKARLKVLKGSMDKLLKQLRTKHNQAIDQISKGSSELDTIKP